MSAGVAREICRLEKYTVPAYPSWIKSSRFFSRTSCLAAVRPHDLPWTRWLSCTASKNRFSYDIKTKDRNESLCLRPLYTGDFETINCKIKTNSTKLLTSLRPLWLPKMQARSFRINPCHFNAPKNRSIEQYLTNKKIPYKDGYTSLMLPCSSCGKVEDGRPTQEDAEKWSLFVNKTTGRFICKNCGNSGSWNDLKVAGSGNENKIEDPTIHNSITQINLAGNEEMLEDSIDIFQNARDISEYSVEEQSSILEKFHIKNLTLETLQKFQIKFQKHKFSERKGSKEKICMTIPWYDIRKEKLIAVKLIPIDNEVVSKIIPRQSSNGLFGYHCLSGDTNQIVITSSELDAMAVSQTTGLNAVSLPTGTSTLPPEVLPHLEPFQKIVLWFGNDLRSKQAINQFSKKLNKERCSFVRLLDEESPNGALEALSKGMNLKSIISKAHSLKHKEILTFNQLREDVYGEFINAEQVAGVKWKRFPSLSGILKGHRRGELTILTGQTGTGKTTLLSELSLDLCSQGVNTLWGSFEIRNVRLVKSMMCQFSGLNLETSIGQYNYWADKFDSMPLYFMSYYGSHSIDSVLETMNDAAYVYDIDHVIIDNLQFMMSTASKFADRFSAMDSAITTFRNFASSKNVHVTLVIHPRKENQDSELQTASIFGTAKASQEADNIIILQDGKGRTSRRYLQITKNRFDGILGKVPLEFNRDSLCMSGFHRDEKTGEGKIPTVEQSAKKNQNWTPFE